MGMKFTSLRRELPKWRVKSIENEWAYLENTDTKENISLPMSVLPKGIRPGDNLVKNKTIWYCLP